MTAAVPHIPSEPTPDAPPLMLRDVVDANERVAVRGEAVPSHVRFVLGFDRRPDAEEVEVVRELLAPFDVVRDVSVEGVEIVSADRENPTKQVPNITKAVEGATEEAKCRVAAKAEKAKAAEERTEGLRSELQNKLGGTNPA